jgi:hypothetical protein
MWKIIFYINHYLEKLELHFNHFLKENGTLLFICILLSAALMVLFVWQKIKTRQAQADFLKNRSFED